jgi:tetratricopeptide (TPR) repeat protein
MSRTALISVALCSAATVFACAIDIGPFFQPGAYPEDETAFRHGQLGLLTPALNTADELIAFRYLSGLTLDADAMKAGLRPTGVPADVTANDRGFQAWMKARGRIASFSSPNFVLMPRGTLVTSRTRQTGSHYVFYRNCLDDAFETAARTLADRQQRYTSEAFKDWIHAQDQVFVNCSSEKPVYPSEPAPNVPELVRADRMYQIAAAHFYAEDFDTAKKLFSAIAQDADSPWQKIGAYMVARTLLREASLENNNAAEIAARDQFQKIADDPSAGSLRDSARGLLRHLDTTEALQVLAKQFMQPHPGASLANTIEESAYVVRSDNFRSALSQPDSPEPFDWVKTFESGDLSHAVERWRATESLPWLTLTLMYSNGKDAGSPQLIEKAARIDKSSPAFATATYNAIRLRMERGETEEPRARLNRLLSGSAEQPASVLNAWRAERMQLATSFDDFLRSAPRTPILVGYEGGPPPLQHPNSPVLANDSTYVLNYLIPIAKLAEAAHSSRLPQWSAADVALAAWTRAFMLENAAVMREMGPILSKAHPGWAADLSPPSGTDFPAWKFRAALLIAHNAEFQPLVPVDYWQHVEPASWWCAVSPPGKNAQDIEQSTAAWRLPAFFEPSESVISKSERSTAEKEIIRLQRIGSAQSLVAPIIFAWAKSHPEDPLVPEALHRIVRVVRYGCHLDPANGELSKAAFDLLHRRYPKSEWTAKTPYWFK